MYVHASPLWPSGASLRGTLRGRTDGRTDGQMYRFPLYSTGLCSSSSLWSRCPAHTTATLQNTKAGQGYRWPSLAFWGLVVYEMNASISYNFGPLCRGPRVRLTTVSTANSVIVLSLPPVIGERAKEQMSKKELFQKMNWRYHCETFSPHMGFCIWDCHYDDFNHLFILWLIKVRLEKTGKNW